MLANIVVISLDMYNDGDKVLENNFDDPRIIDYDTLMQNLADLRAGRPTRVPIYDFRQSKRIGFEDVAVPISRIIIIEGIHALSAQLDALTDLKIAITGGIHFDLVKRVRAAVVSGILLQCMVGLYATCACK
jgi:uridine kinase